MHNLVVLSLGDGDLHNGFPAVTAQLWEHGNPRPMKFTGRLPAAPEIPELYRYWQLLYSALYQRLDLCPRIEIDAADVTNISQVEFSNLCQRLVDSINAWLNAEPFRNIDQQLRTLLDASEEIRIIIETNDRLLRRLPWHLWKFFEHYPKAEVALSPSEYQRSPKKLLIKTPSGKVRILAILGNSKGIDIGKDQAFLAQLSSQAETKFLIEPHLEQLNDQLWIQGWDILFFAGHSSSQGKGQIQINPTESLTLDKLKYALSKAIESGLKLAIFNSCDGLGLAQDLGELQIPQVIVMREPVPDVVAQDFLRHFLAAFSGGQSLYASVREARERLERLEGSYPCATWLPVLCQNPAEAPPTWQAWCGSNQEASALGRFNQRNRQVLLGRRSLRTVFLTSVVVTALVMGVRQLGMLQALELHTFDQLLRLRPAEGPDPRLLVVTVTEADIATQKERGPGSVSDRALAQLLEKLEQYQPRAIGLDIYRDFPVRSDDTGLATRLQQSDRLISVCKVSDPETNDSGVAPPAEVPPERLGFSDVVVDADTRIRRQLLQLTSPPASQCATEYAFSLQLALRYLAPAGIQAQVTPEGYLQLGHVVLKRLIAPAGGYQKVDTKGYQVLLNYRPYRTLQDIAPQVALGDVLNDEIPPDSIKKLRDRIVLIGVSAPSFGDYWSTPYSDGQQPAQQQIPGILVQAQMVSQILSAVLDQRPLLWVWPHWGEALWIWSWALVGGLLAWRFRPLRRLGVNGGSALGTLSVLCFGLLTQGGWVPLVPAALALVMTGTSVVVYTRSRSDTSSELGSEQ